MKNNYMNTREVYHKIALFFYLASLNEKLATEQSIRAAQLIKRRKRLEKKHFDEETAIIEVCQSLLTESQVALKHKQLNLMNATTMAWPDHLDLTPWREFQKRGSFQDRIAVLWVKVIGMPISKVARALMQTEGTIRYRLGKGLAQLGQLNRPNWGGTE